MEKDLPQTVHTGRGFIFFGFLFIFGDRGEDDSGDGLVKRAMIFGEMIAELGIDSVEGVVGVVVLGGAVVAVVVAPVINALHLSSGVALTTFISKRCLDV